MVLVGLDTTIVNVGLPSIGEGLGVPTNELAWVIDAYTVTLASLLITSGALADRFGRRRMFRVGLTVFGLASVACALAPTVEALIAARVVQGVGASMLNPVALAIVAHTMTDPRERARALGFWGALFGISMAAGPLVGGVLIASFGWRSLFWINVPVIAVALLLVAVVIPESWGSRSRRVDLFGQVLLAVVLFLAVGLLIEAPRWGWTAPGTLVGVGVLALALPTFVAVERRTSEPLMELGLFHRPVFTAAVVGAVAAFVALSAALLLITVSTQHGRGWTPLQSGLAMGPMALAIVVFAPVSGLLVARGRAPLALTLAGVTVVVGAVAAGIAGVDGSLSVVLAAYAVIGAGLGLGNAPLTNTAISSLPVERAGVAGAITSTARQFGSALGIAAIGAILAGTQAVQVAAASLPGWLLVASCGAVLLGVAAICHGRRTPRPGRSRTPLPVTR
ncbi:MFS transporter [Nakamurella flava]|uniref:MFS transporter n=2 Tax=Nakamurella flava TaxID=2576308 RepID=A0A4U6QFR9_9ACTN|nr:MFS transporter [Nakamurella flava]